MAVSMIRIGAEVEFSIDNTSNVNGDMLITGVGKCAIGKYCAIGDGVHIVTSNHDYHRMCMQGALCDSIGAESVYVNNGPVIVGHGCWVGHCALILSGVNIGDGSVISAGAVVTKDVESFSVVAGNPARMIKMRFPLNICAELSELKWWDWPADKMRENKALFDADLSKVGSIYELLKKG